MLHLDQYVTVWVQIVRGTLRVGHGCVPGENQVLHCSVSLSSVGHSALVALSCGAWLRGGHGLGPGRSLVWGMAPWRTWPRPWSRSWPLCVQFMSWTDADPLPVAYLGVSTGWGYVGRMLLPRVFMQSSCRGTWIRAIPLFRVKVKFTVKTPDGRSLWGQHAGFLTVNLTLTFKSGFASMMSNALPRAKSTPTVDAQHEWF